VGRGPSEDESASVTPLALRAAGGTEVLGFGGAAPGASVVTRDRQGDPTRRACQQTSLRQAVRHDAVEDLQHRPAQLLGDPSALGQATLDGCNLAGGVVIGAGGGGRLHPAVAAIAIAATTVAAGEERFIR
jgi:hypothetical protein